MLIAMVHSIIVSMVGSNDAVAKATPKAQSDNK